MSKQIEAMKLALEALESGDWYINQLEMIVYSPDDDGTHEEREKVQKAITALREALAEQKSGIKQVIELYDSPEQPEQQSAERGEPVAMYEDWYASNSCGHCGMVGGHANTCRHYKPTPAPAQSAERGEPVVTPIKQELTEEERLEILLKADGSPLSAIWLTEEALTKKGNTK